MSDRLRAQIVARDADCADHLFRLTDQSARRLTLAAASAGAVPFSKGLAESIFHEVAPDLARRLTAFADRGSPLGFFLIDGLSPDPVRQDSEESSAALVLCIAGLIGSPFMSLGHRAGALIHDIYPVRLDATKQLGSGSVELTWHTEDAHAEPNPDFIGLLCMRGDRRAKTLISRVRPEELDGGVTSALARPDFLIAADESFDATVTGRPVKPTPVLRGPADKPIVRFDPLFTDCLTRQAEDALQRLREHLDRRAIEVTLEAGNFLLIDNRCAVHARSAFEPKYDGSDRWVRRVTISSWEPNETEPSGPAA